MDGSEKQRRTIESFNYQWKHLPEAAYLLSDPRWRDNVSGYILDELNVTADQLRGKMVLDAGCGQGRWSYGFYKLGCHVYGFDASPAGIEYAKNAVPNGQFAVADILDLVGLLKLYDPGMFDLIWVWGVLHHTGAPLLAVTLLSRLLSERGMMHAYVYAGKGSRSHVLRWIFNRFSYDDRVKLARLSAKWNHSSVHGNFDAYSPPIAEEYPPEEVAGWFTQCGLTATRIPAPTWCKDNKDIFVNAYAR